MLVQVVLSLYPPTPVSCVAGITGQFHQASPAKGPFLHGVAKYTVCVGSGQVIKVSYDL